MGKFPQQQLLKANAKIFIHYLGISGGILSYTEKSGETMKEGTFPVSGLDMSATNLTNDPSFISRNPVCTASVKALILGTSPLSARFLFRLDTMGGQFTVDGSVSSVQAAQLNPLAEPLGNVLLNSVSIPDMKFTVQGSDLEAIGNVQMLYNGLAITINKMDEETGQINKRKFITKMVNRFVLWPSNPGPDGRMRTGENVIVSRLTTQSFFGLVWKAIFAGMQKVMMKSG
jgi:hypothetical protein